MPKNMILWISGISKLKGLLELNTCVHSLLFFFQSVCLSSTVSACWGTWKEYDCTVCSILCTFVMLVEFLCACKSHSFQNEHMLNLTDLKLSQICLWSSSHTMNDTESPTVNMITYSSLSWCEWIFKMQKKMFFRSWGGHDSLVTDSRSVLELWGLMPLTQRKWAGPVISGTWSKSETLTKISLARIHAETTEDSAKMCWKNCFFSLCFS